MRPVFDIKDVYRIRWQGAVDADGHVLEPANLWDDFIEAKYRDRALRIARDRDGLEYLEISGAPSKMTRKGYPATLGRMGERELEVFTPSPDKTYMANAPYGAMDATERLALLDAEGLDAAVLYPTLGILWEAELEDIELSQAYCRAYNRWIAEFCRNSNGRLIPIAHLSLGDPQAAANELRRAVKDGCRGAFMVPFTITRKAHGDPRTIRCSPPRRNSTCRWRSIPASSRSSCARVVSKTAIAYRCLPASPRRRACDMPSRPCSITRCSSVSPS